MTRRTEPFVSSDSRHSGRESPLILINVPDGHVKEMPTAGSRHKDQPSAKEVRRLATMRCHSNNNQSRFGLVGFCTAVRLEPCFVQTIQG